MPLVEQIANHLAAFRGRFNGSDRIIVWCGNNDVFAQFGAFAAVAAASFVERKIPICNAGKSTLITGGAVADEPEDNSVEAKVALARRVARHGVVLDRRRARVGKRRRRKGVGAGARGGGGRGDIVHFLHGREGGE